MSTSVTTAEKLSALLSLLTSSISTLTAGPVPLPSLDVPYTPASDAPFADPRVLQAATLACAAARQIEVLVRPAKATLSELTIQVYFFAQPC